MILESLTMKCSIVLIFLVTACSALKTVMINKCCDMDEYMTRDNYTCKHERKTPWTQAKIYSKRLQNFLPMGQTPGNWDILESRIPACDHGNEPKLFQYTTGSYLLFGNGSLFIIGYNRMAHPTKYCIDHNVAFVCPEEITSLEAKIMVQKCCGNNAIYSESKQACYPIKGDDYKIPLPQSYNFTSGFPVCNDKKMVIAGKFHDDALQTDGSLSLKETDTLLPAGEYCLEHVLETPGRHASIFTCHSEPPYTVEKHPRQGDLRFTLYPIGLALSAVFLAATLVAGSLLPASHHVLHWRCQTNHVACLLVADILLCIVQLSADTLGKTPCFLIAVAMHFLFLSTFFWLNTMCFNIWWTFRDLRPQSLEKSQERWRLRIYELYAWGVPFLIAATGAMLDTVDSPFLIRPGFTKNACWFAGHKEIFVYFFGPFGCLLIVNMIFFAATARELTCGLWKRELVKSTTERAALGRVCMKLVVVMGVTWVADVVSWAVGGPQEIWYLTDIINCLQGVFIFIVVGLQPQVLAAVKRLWCLRKNRAAETAGTTNHHSSSSQGLPSMGDTITNNSITNGTTKSVPLETSC